MATVERPPSGLAASLRGDPAPSYRRPLYGYHGGANSIMAVGILSGIVAVSFELAPAWVGFLIGAVPAFFVIALAYAISDE